MFSCQVCDTAGLSPQRQPQLLGLILAEGGRVLGGEAERVKADLARHVAGADGRLGLEHLHALLGLLVELAEGNLDAVELAEGDAEAERGKMPRHIRRSPSGTITKQRPARKL